MSTSVSWRLSARITRWCLAVGTGFVTLLAVIGCVLVHLETRQELEATVAEELGEMVLAFAQTDGTRADFEACLSEPQEAHPDDGLAWRVWQLSDDSVWDSFGPASLLARMPGARELTRDPGGSLAWRTAQLTPELEVGLLFDGQREVGLERRFLVAALSTVAVAAALSFLAGALGIGGVVLMAAGLWLPDIAHIIF